MVRYAATRSSRVNPSWSALRRPVARDSAPPARVDPLIRGKLWHYRETMANVRVHRWDEIALEKITEMISQKIVVGERELLAQIYLKRGALVPMHAHESEQMTYILQGALRVLVDG